MMLVAPIAHIEAIDRSDLNRLLVRWEHRMGPYMRPTYKFEAHHALFEHGEPIAVTAAGETVRETVGRETGIRREDVVELARLCAARRDLCRPMLRLWREMIYPRLAEAHGRSAAVSYQDEALHSGCLYRLDGWRDLGPAGGGGSPDGRTGRRTRRMRVWGWPHDAVAFADMRRRAAA